MFYNSVHRLRLWLWKRQEGMLERTHRLRQAESASTLPNGSGTAGYGAGADAGLHAGMLSGYASANVNTTNCSDGGSSCSSGSASGSCGGGGD